LDVAYFHPMKVAWRNILQEWRRTAEGERFSTLPKDIFAKFAESALYTSIKWQRAKLDLRIQEMRDLSSEQK
jgi:hypothetical protein